jgi:hypothetical protein
MSELNTEQQFEHGRRAFFRNASEGLDAQTFGKESVEHSLGHQQMESVDPLPSDRSDVEITTTELEDAAAALTKDRNERLGRPPGEVVREYKQESPDGPKLDERLTVSAEQAAADLTVARNREENSLELDERAELQTAIDALRNGTEQFQPQPVEQQPQAWEQQQLQQPVQQAPLTEQERMARVLQENPQLLAGMQATIEQEQAKYAAAVHHNAHAAMAHTLASFPELVGINDPSQLAGALHAVRSRDPARAAAITETIARTRQFVEESQRVAAAQEQQQQVRVQQWVNQYDANMRHQFAQHDSL